MTSDRHDERGTYEVRINGLLGPLLLGVLPHAAVSFEPRHTLVVTTGTGGSDLLSVVQVLVESGAEVDSVRELAEPSVRNES